MESTSKLTFRQAALASGLISQDQLREAYASAGISGLPAEPTPRDDERLAKALIKQGLLNRWQVEQLKEGRTKFTLGPYRIIDSIGKGGMGHVFKGQHELLGRIEAIKVLPKDRTSAATIESFHREIRAQAQLDHSNLVRVSYAGQEGDTYFLVTEYVPGTDLRHLVRRHGRLTMHEAATIIAQAAQGLGYAHREGLVHRDVKPGNLLVTPEGKTKVIDLGLAWYLNRTDETDAYAGKLVGTADYLAPELIRMPGDPRPTSDIYSLGCTLYYAVSGKVPFPGGRTSDKLRRHLEEAPLNPRRFNPDLSDMFLDVLADMMEKDPVRRIRSMEDVVERLRPWSLANVGLGTPPGKSPARGEGAAEGAPERSDMTGESRFPDTSDTSFGDLADRPSQVSQATSPFASWREDTDAVEVLPKRKRRTSRKSRLPTAVLVLVVLAVVSIATLVAILVARTDS
jgi:eukaryotic-like serine/threonine-protein kinase